MVTVERVTGALLSGRADAREAAAAVCVAHDDTAALRRALAALEADPRDAARARDFAAELLTVASDRPELATWLCRWSDPVSPAVSRGTDGRERPDRREQTAQPRAGDVPGHTNSIAGAPGIAGGTVQARDIAGGVHFHARPSPSLPIPRELLPVPAFFVERAMDAAALGALRAARLLVVSGPAGVGKTTFVSHWLTQLRDEFPDGQLYADLRGHSPGAPAVAQEVLGHFLRAYGFTDLPADPAEQAALWRSVSVNLRIAVMLDDAVSAAQVRPLLPGARDSLVVVVSRRKLSGLLADGAVLHELGLLEPAAGAELLTVRIGDRRAGRERDAVDEIVALCGGLPLAICLAGARMLSRPRQTVASMADALKREGGRLAALRADGRGAVLAALDESYAALPPHAARGYRYLGTLPFTVFGAEVMAAVCAVPIEQAHAVADELVEVNLLEDLGDDLFRFHDLVRLHAAERSSAQDPAEATRAGVLRAVGWYLATATAVEALLTPSHRDLPRDLPAGIPAPLAFDDAGSAVDWLSREQPQLITALRTARDHSWDAVVWQLADALWPLWNRLRPYELWIEAHRIGLAAARRDGNPRGVSRMLTTGGGALLNAGYPDEALTWYTEALDGARGDRDQKAEAQSLHGIGRAHQQAGRLAEATSYLSRALVLREAIGYRRGAALTRVCLGDIAAIDGRPDDAVGQLTVAYRELVAVRDRHDAARALALLGRAQSMRGDFDTAGLHLATALEEFRAIGSVHWQGRTMEMLGLTDEDRGSVATAREWFGRSLAVYASISPSDTDRLRERISTLDGHSA